MAPRDLSPLYDAMWRLFMVGMSECKLPVGFIGQILDIPPASAMAVHKACPLPAHISTVVGGHRNKEVFLHADSFNTKGKEELAAEIIKESVWEKYGVCIDRRVDSVVAEINKVVTNVIGTGVKSHVAMRNIVETGKPVEFRVMWFIKDKSTMEFYDTVHQALATSARILRAPHRTKVEKAATVATPVVKESVPAISTLRMLWIELGTLLDQKEKFEKQEMHYKEMIEHLQSKVNIQYGEIISRKESEAAALRKQVENLTGDKRLLEKEVLGFQNKIKELTQYVSRRGKPR